MATIIDFIHGFMPVLHTVAAIAITTKIILISKYRRFQLPYFFYSMIRFYSFRDRINTSNSFRLRYMSINNWLNIYLYVWVLLTLYTLFIYR